MIKAYPRAWLDLKNSEILSILLQLSLIKRASGTDKIEYFNRAFADYIGTAEAHSFTSCPAATFFALKALELDKGSEVIMPAYTFWVDAAVIALAGLTPVFVDVDFYTHNIDASQIEKAITPKTKVLFPTHLNGLPADMDDIMALSKKYNLRVFEDTARSCGASYKGKKTGSFDIGLFSFGYGKSFYCFHGSMVTSNDKEFMNRLKELKKKFTPPPIKYVITQAFKGMILKYLNNPRIYRFSLFPMARSYQINGNKIFSKMFKVNKPPYQSIPRLFTQEMFNIQAKQGMKQLKRIDLINHIRVKNAMILTKELSDIKEINIPKYFNDRDHLATHYAIWTENKDALQNYLFKHHIDAQDESAEDITQMPQFVQYKRGKYTAASNLQNKVLFIPTHPHLKPEDMLYMAGVIKNFFKKKMN
ncbi:MAG: aminotransferase class I/II-fold pyridoxal phosphate-dependent enzyme [Desulfobacterales bacterium]|nr:aminotransferase class I/II-fold pyridoxal phosphate-dependent enzyme [Desulfobacterales bacterium]